MYARYTYKAGATTANILADIVALVTGATDETTLSASCDQAQTEIVAEVAAGWSLHDANAGSLAKTVKAPLADDATKYKYVTLDMGSTGYMLAILYENWDAGSHSGTYKANNSDTTTNSQRLDTTNGGTLYIFASARYFVMVGAYGSIWGASTNAGPTGCVERTRDNAALWDTVSAGYPPFAFINLGAALGTTSASAWAPRLLKRDRTTVSGSSAPLVAATIGYTYLNAYSVSGVDQKLPDSGSGVVIPFMPIILTSETLMPAPYGEISSLCDIWMIPMGVATTFDLITKDGNSYICMRGYDSNRMLAFRKG